MISIKTVIKDIAIFVLLSVFMYLLFMSCHNYRTITKKIMNFDMNKINLYLRVSDKYDNDGYKTLTEFFKEDKALKRLKDFNKEICNTYDVYEFNTQPVTVRNFPSDDQSFIINNANKAIQLGSQFNFKNEILEGSYFTESDYVINDDDFISVILGYHYKEFYKVGDIITIDDYLLKKIQAKVIGFFVNDTVIIINKSTYDLNEYIIMPYFDINADPINDSDMAFQERHYSAKTWGYIPVQSGEDYFTYYNDIVDIAKKYDLDYTVTEGYAREYVDNISYSLNSIQGFAFIFNITLVLLISSYLVFINIQVYKSNNLIYMIHMICGYSFTKIKMYFYIKTALLYIISFLVGFFVYDKQHLYTYPSIIIENATTILLIVLVNIIIINSIYAYYFKKYDIFTILNKTTT